MIYSYEMMDEIEQHDPVSAEWMSSNLAIMMSMEQFLLETEENDDLGKC